MASHKNQHYVPRCYLRPFSLYTEGHAINLFNLDSNRAIRNAPLKSQCSGDYFYGKDLALEQLLQKSEGLYSQLLGRVTEPRYALSEVDKVILRHFCYLQHCRTEAAARRAAMFPSAMVDLAYKGDPPPSWRSTFREDVIHAMRAFSDTMHVVTDLKVCLLLNETGISFIASDDPAVLTNRFYLQDKRARGMGGGAASAGAVFFMPLTPTIACAVYDGDVYSIPHESGWVTMRNPYDATSLNEQQYLHCVANVYFADWCSHEGVIGAFAIARERRVAQRHRVNTAIFDSETEDGARFRVIPQEELPEEARFIVHVQTITPAPARWPSFLKWRSHRRIYTNGTGTGFVRRWPIESGFYPGAGYKRIA